MNKTQIRSLVSMAKKGKSHIHTLDGTAYVYDGSYRLYTFPTTDPDCDGCQFPSFNQIKEKTKDRGAAFVGVSTHHLTLALKQAMAMYAKNYASDYGRQPLRLTDIKVNTIMTVSAKHEDVKVVTVDDKEEVERTTIAKTSCTIEAGDAWNGKQTAAQKRKQIYPTVPVYYTHLGASLTFTMQIPFILHALRFLKSEVITLSIPETEFNPILMYGDDKRVAVIMQCARSEPAESKED